MSYWEKPLKQIGIDIKIIASQNRKADSPSRAAIWAYCEDIMTSLHGLKQALEHETEMKGK